MKIIFHTQVCVCARLPHTRRARKRAQKRGEMGNRKGVHVRSRREVNIKKIKKYLSQHMYTIICVGAGLLVVLIVVGVIVAVNLNRSVEVSQAGSNDVRQSSSNDVRQSSADDKNNHAENKTEEAKDVTAPVISGVEDKTFALGDKISYLSGVTASDDVDGEVEVEVDKSEVDVNTPGTYTVTYRAVDAAGNESTAKASITIKKPAPVEGSYQALAQEILGNITDDTMSMGQKLRAIFDYAHNKIGYTGICYDGADWEHEALLALTELKKSDYTGGDCFTYTSVDRALLEALGVKVLWLENENSPTGDHAWLLVDAGTGWYHFDSTRMRSGFVCFMKTDKEIQDYLDQGNYNYVRDLSKYPATPTTPYSY